MAEERVKRLLKSIEKKIAKIQKQQQQQKIQSVEEEEEERKRKLGFVEEEQPTAASVSCGVSGMKRKFGCTRLTKAKDIGEDYTFGDELGKGTYGSVRRCYSKSKGFEYACKTILKGELSDSVHQEIEIMRHLSGDRRVVNLVAVYEDAKAYHLVMDLYSGGDLFKVMDEEGGQFSEYRAARITKELISLIQYCHHMGVVHRDIKPENILLSATGGDMVLADFGFAARCLPSRGKLLFGDACTPSYMAPEIVSEGKYYSEKVDIWSAGVILHTLLVGKQPFDGDTMEEKFAQIEHANLNFDTADWSSISLPARDLIKKMLNRDPSLRLSADEVLVHPWITLYAKEEQPTSASVNAAEKPHSQPPATPPQPHGEEISLLSKLAAAVSHIRISKAGAVEPKLKPGPKRCRLWDPRIVNLQHAYRFSNPCAAAY